MLRKRIVISVIVICLAASSVVTAVTFMVPVSFP